MTRFLAPLVGASFAGGVLAAAAEYIMGSFLGGTAFWAVPRFYYQLLFAVEAAWLGLLAAFAFGVGGGIYCSLIRRKDELDLASPALWVVAVAACGGPAAYFLASTDASFPGVSSRFGIIAAGAFFLAVMSLWVVFAAVLYKAFTALGRRLKRFSAKGVAGLAAIALLLPIVVADVYGIIVGAGTTERRPDVYVVIMDAFRADRLSFYGAEGEVAPRLEAFGREGVVFEEAFTVSSWTKPAVASLFLSAYPGTHGVNSRVAALPAGADTLPEVMGRLGYVTLGVSANPRVSWGGGLGDGFAVLDTAACGSIMEAGGPPLSAARLLTSAEWVPYFLGPMWHRTADGRELNRRLEFWLRITEGPRFVYVHYMEPHTPYRSCGEDAAEFKPYFERARKSKVAEIVGGRFFGGRLTENPRFRPDYTPAEVALAKALYDADVRCMDVVIADLLDAIVPAYSRGEEPVIVITADHGEEFLEHGRWLHCTGLHGEIARVPLMIGSAGRGAVRGAVNVADVAPTVVALVGGVPPEDWAGADLTPYLYDGGRVPSRELLLEGIIEHPPARAEDPWASIELAGVVNGDHYYLYYYNAGAEYLYDERRDAKQAHNLARDDNAAENGGLLARRRQTLASLRKAARARAMAPRYVKPPSSLERQLRAMGYVN